MLLVVDLYPSLCYKCVTNLKVKKKQLFSKLFFQPQYKVETKVIMTNKKISLEDLPNLTMELINKVDILTKMVSELAGLVRPEQNSSEKMSLEEVAIYLNQSKHTIYKKVSAYNPLIKILILSYLVLRK